MKWHPLPAETLIARLAPPSGTLDMVLDTDTYNEVDDQFALCYALLSPKKLNVEAIYAAPYYNDRSTGPEDGMERSYDEIVRLIGLLGKAPEGFVYKGSRAYLPGAFDAVDSPAARDLIERAMKRPDGDPLYVVAIGAITNVASALILEPRLTEKIVVVWLGGHQLNWPTTREFNLMQDVHAARVIFDSGVPLMLMPCCPVASHLTTSVYELKACIGGKNALCDALIDLFAAYSKDHFAWAKELWDVSVIGFLINPDWVQTTVEPSPRLSDDCRWSRDATRHPIRVAYQLQRNAMFADMYRKLANAGSHPSTPL